MRLLRFATIAGLCVIWLGRTIALADDYYDKFGIHARDVSAYRNLPIPSCQAGLHDDRDPLKPPADACQATSLRAFIWGLPRSVEQRHAVIGVLRFNDMLLGMTCIALGSVDVDDPVDPMCNVKSALPH
jgi:hypothetical protein